MSEWISVKERLPETDDLVLALVEICTLILHLLK